MYLYTGESVEVGAGQLKLNQVGHINRSVRLKIVNRSSSAELLLLQGLALLFGQLLDGLRLGLFGLVLGRRGVGDAEAQRARARRGRGLTGKLSFWGPPRIEVLGVLRSRGGRKIESQHAHS
mgnify:CR=1 FL=1